MLPILISQKCSFSIIIKILLIKVLIGMLAGFIIDFIIRKKTKSSNYEIKKFCDEEHCDCEHGIIKSSIKHTFNILIFIIVITLLLNLGFYYFGNDSIEKLFLKDSFFSPFISSLIGLIPNCGASVALTELYLNNVISFASVISGLLTGSGVALLVLFKINKNVKENVKILLTLYFIGALSGILIEIIQMLF